MQLTATEILMLLTALSTLILGILQFRNQKRKTDSESLAGDASAANQIANTAVNVLLAPLKQEIAELRKRVEDLENFESAYRYLRGEALKNDMPIAVEIADLIASGKAVTKFVERSA